MSSDYVSKTTRTKIDWFVDGVLKQTFDSYVHAAEILKIHYKYHTFSDVTVRNLLKNNGKFSKSSTSRYRRIYIFKDDVLINTFNTNVEFANYYKLSIAYVCNIIKGKYTSPVFKDHRIETVFDVPDIRFHVFQDTGIYQTCYCCKESKPYNEKYFFYRNKQKGEFLNKCKECVDNTIYKKNLLEFSSKLNENWKFHPEFTQLYFERDTINIFNRETGQYITCDTCLNGKIIQLRNLKWEAFHGKIPQHQIVKYKNKEFREKDRNDSLVSKFEHYTNEGIELDNLECVYIYCETCKKLVENPKFMDQIYCSKKCQNINSRVKKKNRLNTHLNRYISNKLSIHKSTNKNYNTLVDYDSDHLVSLGLNCYYCQTECSFGYSLDSWHADTLSYDKKNPDIGYIKENVVVCCWFCNRMKNQTKYPDWVQFIDFVKNKETKVLDLSNKSFGTKSSEVNISNICFHTKQKSPSYYQNMGDAKQTFINICKTQNYLDPYFHFFPIIYLESNCLFNASIDAINAKLPNEEKHRPDNLQIVPKCFNYGKNILSNEEFVKEWTKRGFKTDFSSCVVKLPEGYVETSYFHNFI